MNTQRALEELDQLFEQKRIVEVEGFLLGKMAEAKREGDIQSTITFLNEAIGYYRDTSQYDKALSCCSEVQEMLEQLGMQGTIPYATTMLNIANAHRAAGNLEDSMGAYAKVFAIYEQCIEPTDFRYASLFNNLSLLYQEMGDFNRAVQSLTRALEIVQLYPEARIELATTHTNLAASLLKTDQWEEAKEHLDLALSIFEETKERDFHYGAALSALGEYLFRIKDYPHAVESIKRAMQEQELHVGKTEAYYRLADNLEKIQAIMQEEQGESDITNEAQQRHQNSEKIKTAGNENIEIKNGMELCRQYYETYKNRLLQLVPGFENHIAAGLVGEGSECFGWDDEYSRDHDWGPGFCIWLTDQDYSYFGAILQAEYDKLPGVLRTEPCENALANFRRISTPQGMERVGVMRISDFYQRLLGIKGLPERDADWLYISEDRLAAATNGCIFTDPLGRFTEIREHLKYYPENIRIRKLAQELALMAQTGQYNYARMLKRGDAFTAQMQLADFMKHAIKAVYLLNRTYAPHDKWLYHGMKELPILQEVSSLLGTIFELSKVDTLKNPSSSENFITMNIEIIAKLMTYELQKQGLSKNDDTFLMVQAEEIMTKIK